VLIFQALASQAALAGWLSVCAEQAAGVPFGQYQMPDGGQQWLQLVEQPVPGCVQADLGLPAAAIRWAGLIPPESAAHLDKGVSLLADADSQMTAVSEVIPSSPNPTSSPAVRPSLAIGGDTLAEWGVRSFGNPQRARWERVELGLRLHCTAGDNVAGLLLTASQQQLPVAAKLAASMHYSANADFALGFSDAQQLRAEAPVALGKLSGQKKVLQAQFVLPPSASPQDHGLSVFCPPGAAELALQTLSLQPVPVSKSPPRSTWVWQASAAVEQADELLAQLQQAEIQTVFLAVSLSGSPLQISRPDALADFIKRANDLEIEVWVVEGDAQAVTAEGWPHFFARTQAIVRFNQAQAPSQRFRGVQYDIEPYLLPGFRLATNDWLVAYLRTLRQLRAQWQIPMEVAVPFWWAGLRVDDEPILSAMTDLVDGLTVMNYRTDTLQLQQLAQPFLSWGNRGQRYVRVAVESVALPDQDLWHFRAGDVGRLWHIPLDGLNVLLLLDRPAANPFGASFQRSYAIEVPATGTTFQGQPELLEASLPGLVQAWSAWTSFAGVALHGYLPDLD
jgi:hypothetical protein